MNNGKYVFSQLSAKLHDVNAMDFIPYESEAYYVFDRGYLDFKRLYHMRSQLIL